MHPFFMLVLQALNYGIGHNSPNQVLQINGMIAWCNELVGEPSLDLFFSLYRLKSTGVKVYFDAKPGCTKLVSTMS